MFMIIQTRAVYGILMYSQYLQCQGYFIKSHKQDLVKANVLKTKCISKLHHTKSYLNIFSVQKWKFR